MKQREVVATSRKSRYVTKLFTYNGPREVEDNEQFHEPRLPSPYEEEDSNSKDVAAELSTAIPVSEPLFIGPNQETLYNWEHFDITQWDDFLQFTTTNSGAVK